MSRGRQQSRWVSLSKIKVDPTYQRPVTLSRIKRYAGTWDDEAAGVVVLSLRANGTYYVVDGLHRVLAAREAGRTEIRAITYEHMTRSDEARLWRELNDEVSPRSEDRFRAALAEGQPEAKEILRTAEACGYRIDFHNAGDPTTNLRAPARLYKLLRAGVLESTLLLCKETWPTDLKKTDILAAVGIVLAVNMGTDFDSRRAVERWQTVTPAALNGQANATRGTLGGAVAPNMAAILVRLYNSGLRNHRLQIPPPGSKGSHFAGLEQGTQSGYGHGARREAPEIADEDEGYLE